MQVKLGLMKNKEESAIVFNGILLFIYNIIISILRNFPDEPIVTYRIFDLWSIPFGIAYIRFYVL